MSALTPEREALLRIKADGKREKDLRILFAEIDRLREALEERGNALPTASRASTGDGELQPPVPGAPLTSEVDGD